MDKNEVINRICDSTGVYRNADRAREEAELLLANLTDAAMRTEIKAEIAERLRATLAGNTPSLNINEAILFDAIETMELNDSKEE